MIARPIRRTGPIPFAPFPPLAERPQTSPSRESRDIRETRMRSRWLPTLNPTQPLPDASARQAQQLILQASRPECGARGAHAAASSNNPGGHRAPADTDRTLPTGSATNTRRSPRGGCHAVYHGQGTLSVLSSITGHHYRFEGRGCTLTIDPRDRLVLGRLNELSIHSTSD